MKPAGEELKVVLDTLTFNGSDVKLVANTSVEFVSEVEELKEELYKQTFGPVRWVETIAKLKENGVTEFYEIGPGKVLKGLVKKIDKELEVTNLEKLDDLGL
jgi:[acyl-carrier-protein] S-malonyltransferase